MLNLTRKKSRNVFLLLSIGRLLLASKQHSFVWERNISIVAFQRGRRKSVDFRRSILFGEEANIDDCRRRRLLCVCLIRIFSRIIPSRRFVESYGNKQSSCFAPSVSSPSHLTSFRKTLFGWLFIAVAFRALRKPRKKRKMKINQTETVFARYNFTFQRHDKNCGLPGCMKKKGNKLGMVRLMRRLREASSMNFNYCNLRAFSQQNLS